MAVVNQELAVRGWISDHTGGLPVELDSGDNRLTQKQWEMT
jgi:hypothetical protein